MAEPEPVHLLVDGPNLLARAAFAAKGRGVALSAHGVDTAALVLFIKMLSKFVRLVAPTHVAVYWDAGHTFRDRVYPDYKANRESSGSQDSLPMGQAKKFLTWAGVPHRTRPGWEADDLIAFTARHTSGAKVIVSSDKDLLQLLGPSTVQYRPPDDDVWTPERFEAVYGFPAAQMPYVKALMGDQGDNVPGLTGVGPKKAVRMLQAASWDFDALVSTLSPEDAQRAAMSLELVDLRYLDYQARGFSVANAVISTRFAPTGPEGLLWDALVDFLTDLKMQQVLDRLADGSLWTDPSAPARAAHRDQSAAVFVDYPGS